MDKTFDELFEDFFNRKPKKTKRKIKSRENEFESLDEMIKRDIKKLIDSIDKNLEPLNNASEEMEKLIDAELGNPDKIEFYNDGDMFFEKRIWHTPKGDLIKVIVRDEPKLYNPPTPKKSLQEQLNEAVANEEFEKAAAIRDEINKPKATRKPRLAEKKEVKKQKN